MTGAARPIGRFRLGGGGRVGEFAMARATNADRLVATIAGVYVRASFDVFRFADDRDAIHLVAKGSMDPMVGAALYGVGIGAGARF